MSHESTRRAGAILASQPVGWLDERKRAVRAGLVAGAAGTGLAAAATAAAWHWLARRPLPKQKGTIELAGLEGPVRVRRDRWGVPHVEAGVRRRPLVRRGLLPRPGPALADGLLPPRPLRPRLRVRRRGGAAGRPADAHPGHAAHGRARGGGARPRAARPARALLRGRQRGGGERQGAALRDAAAAARVRALAPGRHPRPRQAARLRPLDQLGEGAAARRHDPRARPRAGRQARPRLPGGQPGRHPGSLVGRRSRPRRADRRGAPLDRHGRRGERLQQLGGQRGAERDRLAADRRRPPPAAEHAGHLVPGRPQRSATASSAAPRCRACPASTWARTTTSAGPSPT